MKASQTFKNGLPAPPRTDSPALQRRASHVEPDQIEQCIVRQLSEADLTVTGQDIVRQFLLLRDHLIDAFFNRASGHEFVHQHIVSLADAKGTVGGLILDRWIPPAIEVDDV